MNSRKRTACWWCRYFWFIPFYKHWNCLIALQKKDDEAARAERKKKEDEFIRK